MGSLVPELTPKGLSGPKCQAEDLDFAPRAGDPGKLPSGTKPVV